jgi:glycosyltransferase involved in cell wall biosynthesis
MKLIHTISALDVFGPEKTVINECRVLREEGWDCRIVNFWEDPDVPISEKIAAAGIPYECIATRGKLDFTAIRALAQQLRGLDKPLVHSHGYKADMYSLLAARLAGAPVVTTVHGWTSENRKVRLYEKLQAFLWRFFDQVICVSESYRQTAERSGVAARKLVVVHNGILASYRPGDVEVRRRIRAELGLSESQVAVASVGRLGIEKGHRLFVEAVARLVPSHPQARFFIVGDGAERDNIVAQIGRLGIEDHVKLLGHRDDLPALYQGLDVLAISSLREGLPNVLLEAMLNGMPAVAMAVGGIPEVVQDGHDGLLVDPGNLSQFVGCLGRLLADSVERRRMGDAAQVTVTTRFLFDKRMEEMIRLYLSKWSEPLADEGRA